MNHSPWNHSDFSDEELITKLRELIHQQDTHKFRIWIMGNVLWNATPCQHVFSRLYDHSTSPFELTEWLEAANAVQMLEDFRHG